MQEQHNNRASDFFDLHGGLSAYGEEFWVNLDGCKTQHLSIIIHNFITCQRYNLYWLLLG